MNRVLVFLFLSLLVSSPLRLMGQAPTGTRVVKSEPGDKALSQRPTAAEAFTKLQTLEGRWKHSNKNELIDYRTMARGSVLVETWTWPDRDVDGMTLYHLDGERLMATHYCPVGNQPRLLFDAVTDGEKFVFKFHSATNLVDRNQSHCVEFWLRLQDANTLSRSETYAEQGGLDEAESVYHRVIAEDK